MITIAVAGLTGVRFKRGFMLAAQLVYTIGVVFAYWLFAQAYFVIGALLPVVPAGDLVDHAGVRHADPPQHS